MSKEDSMNQKQPDRSKMGVKPTQPLLFDGPIQKDSNIRPKESAPQHTEVSGVEPDDIHTAEPIQEEPAQIEPHTPSEQTKKFLEKYKKDRKAGKVNPLIPPSQRMPDKVITGDGLSEVIHVPEEAHKKRHDKRGGFHFIPDAQDWKDMIYIGGYYLEGGIHNYAEWSKKVIETLGDGVKPHLDEIWCKAQKEYRKEYPEPEEIAGIEATESKKEISRDAYVETPRQGDTDEKIIYFVVGAWIVSIIASAIADDPTIFKIVTGGILLYCCIARLKD